MIRFLLCLLLAVFALGCRNVCCSPPPDPDPARGSLSPGASLADPAGSASKSDRWRQDLLRSIRDALVVRPRSGKATIPIDAVTVTKIERDLAYLETEAAKRSANIVFIRGDGTIYTYHALGNGPGDTTLERGRWYTDGDEVVYEITHLDGRERAEPYLWRDSRSNEYFSTYLWLGEETFHTFNERPDLTTPEPSGK